jgi:hypothetical protein
MRLHVVVLCWALLVALGVSPLRADAPPSLQSNLMNPLISLNALFLGNASPDSSKVSYAPDEANDGLFVQGKGTPYHFGLQEAELGVESVVDSYFKLNANLTFADGEAGAEEVFATSRSLPEVQVKVGKFKTAFGKLGVVHLHMFPFITAPLAYENTIGSEGFNGEGVEAAWMTPAPWFLELTGGGYSAGKSEDGSVDWSGARKDDFIYLGHLKNFFDLGADKSLEFGFSGMSGHTELGETQRVGGIDLTLKNAPPRNIAGHTWIFQNEWLQKSTGTVKEQEGWYSSLKYRLGSDWWAGVRTERTIRAADAAYVATGVSDDSGEPLYAGLTGDERRHTVEITWAPGEFTEIRADYSYGTVHSAAGETLDRCFLIQFNHTIGTHPAHNF